MPDRRVSLGTKHSSPLRDVIALQFLQPDQSRAILVRWRCGALRQLFADGFLLCSYSVSFRQL